MNRFGPHIRRRRKDALAGQVLGVYKGPQRTGEPPKLTAYRLTLLRAIDAKEIRAGQGSYAGAWRWHTSTVTKAVTPLIRCGWAHEVGKHLELTDAGRQALEAL